MVHVTINIDKISNNTSATALFDSYRFRDISYANPVISKMFGGGERGKN